VFVRIIGLLSVSFFIICLTLGCSSCNFVRNDSFEYRCIPTNSAVSVRTGMAIYQKILEDGNLELVGPTAEADYRTWILGAKHHLDERFTKLGLEGFEMVGVAMYDAPRDSIWVCFKRRKSSD